MIGDGLEFPQPLVQFGNPVESEATHELVYCASFIFVYYPFVQSLLFESLVQYPF